MLNQQEMAMLAEAIAEKVILKLTGSTRDIDRIAELPLDERKKYWQAQRKKRREERDRL